MSVRNFGEDRAAHVALMVTLLAATASASAQDSGAATQNPPRAIDFRLQPEDDGRAPGVQGPADNGLPPVAPGERRGPPTPAPTPAPTSPATPPRVVPTQPDTASTPAPAPARRPAPAATDAPRADAAADAAPPLTPPDAADSPPIDSAATAPDMPAPEAAATASPAPPADAAPSDTPIWAWVLAALAALGAGLWYWRRRAAPVGPALDEAPEAAPPPRAPR
ncbi:MAG: hypothetical protein ACK4FC_15860, partial [Sphingopyxis alaskensis]